ncbi:MAG TPA: diguanylate cyclase [Phycisphaerae bacterium]|nr:diguanylate cyclase [Phycisphaerae bacterium]
MSEPAKPLRVLIVEDDVDHRDLLCDSLATHYGPLGNVHLAGVGSAAECLAQDLAGFDVVLLDYHLPDAEGIDLLGQVLAAADVPVVFVTGENDCAIAAEAIRRGAQDYVVKMGDYLFAIPVVIEKSLSQHRVRKENERLRAQLEAMLVELQRKNSQLEQSLEQVRTLAATDHLTGLANRRWFAAELDRRFAEAVRYGDDLTCCMCDLDHYKQLNDALGHQVGDDVLVLAAGVIGGILRRSDLAARYGGDEFVLLLSQTGCQEALVVGDRLRRELARRLAGLPRPAQAVTVSMGIASLRADRPGSADALISQADRALYAAKSAGRDRIVLHGALCRAMAT